MIGHSDFSDDELWWLVEAERTLVVNPPAVVATTLLEASVINRTERGLKLTGRGRMVLSKAREGGRRVRPRTTPWPG